MDRIKRIISNTLKIIMCVFAAIGLTYDKSVDILVFDDFYAAGKPCIGITSGIILIGFIFLCFKLHKDILFNNLKWPELILAFIFSQMWWFGAEYDYSKTHFNYSAWNLVFYSLVSIGVTYLTYVLIKTLVQLILSKSVIETEKKIPDRKKIFGVSLIIILVIWCVYYIILFPGVVTWDSYVQINQALGFTPLSNHHPFLHTLLESVFLKVTFNIFGSIQVGIAIFVFSQMIVKALIVAYSQVVLIDLKIKRIYRRIAFIFYAFHPLIGVYSVTMWKDVWMAMMLLLYLLILIRLVYLENSEWKILLSLLLVTMGVLFSKATGIAMIGISLVALVIVLWKNRKQCIKVFCSVFLGIVLWYGIQAAAINLFGVAKTESGESKSIILQQIARTVKEHGEELTQGEKTSINEILPYNELANIYNPRLSDPVKARFNEENYSYNTVKYLKLWGRLGLKYSDSYISAFLNNTYGYWYPEADAWYITYDSYNLMLKRAEEMNITVHDPYFSEYDMSDKYFENREKIIYYITYDRRIPGVSAFFSIAFYFWMFAIMAVGLIRKKDKRGFLLISLPIAVFISCIISPVYAEMRYAYPAIFIAPAISILTMYPNNEIKDRPKEV